MKQRKSIKSRIMAALGAIFLTAYAMADTVSTVALTLRSYAADDIVPDYISEDTITEESENNDIQQDNISSEVSSEQPLQEDVSYTDLSDEALAEENIPDAGYEEYSAEMIESLRLASPQVNILAKDGSDDSNTRIDWNSIVDSTYIPSASSGENPLKTFEASYTSDILESNGKDNSAYLYRDHNFTVKYTVTLNTAQAVEAGNAVIRIPRKLLEYRDGSPILIADGTEGIALPQYSTKPTESMGDSEKFTAEEQLLQVPVHNLAIL